MPGCVPHISDITGPDYHLLVMWKTSHQVSLLLSVLGEVVGLSVLFSSSGRAVTKFFYTFSREKAILHNGFQPLSCWLCDSCFWFWRKGQFNYSLPWKLCYFHIDFTMAELLIVVSSLPFFSWYICLWNSLPNWM